MDLEYRTSFVRDLRRVRSAEIRRRVERTIGDLEAAATIDRVAGAASIKGPGRYYRIRIGDYRLGMSIDGHTAILVRLLHRRDIYRYFP